MSSEGAAIDSMWDYANPHASEARFREAFARSDADGVRGDELLTQIARAQCLQRRYDDALATLDRVPIGSVSQRVVVRYHLERGRVMNDTLAEDRGKADFVAAWETARASGLDGFAVDAAHMLGVSRPPAEALRWHEAGMRVVDTSDDPAAKNWRNTLTTNLGLNYHQLGRYADALALFEGLLSRQVDAGQTDRARLTKLCIAKTLRLMDRPAEAMAINGPLLEEVTAHQQNEGYYCEEIAECLLAMGKAAEARPFFARAHAALSGDPWFAPTERERLERMKRLA